MSMTTSLDRSIERDLQILFIDTVTSPADAAALLGTDPVGLASEYLPSNAITMSSENNDSPWE